MTFSTEQQGMKVDWDVPIEMDDGNVLRADIFRPLDVGKYPVLITYGPYAKGLPFQKGYPSAWNRMITEHPDVPYGSSNLHQNWEVVDPEKWVQEGYVIIRVDSRGTGRSPGFIDHFSPRETKDFHDCIEWAGVQKWSTGKVCCCNGGLWTLCAEMLGVGRGIPVFKRYLGKHGTTAAGLCPDLVVQDREERRSFVATLCPEWIG